MNPRDVLAAIEEEKRWIGRRERLVDELKRTQDEKKRIMNELLTVKEDITKLDEALFILSSEGALSHSSPLGISTFKL